MRDDAVTGVVLANGEEIAAPVVVSTADPARTLLGMVDPVWLDPEFLHAVRNIKFRGCTALVHVRPRRSAGRLGPRDPSAALAEHGESDAVARCARARVRRGEVRARFRRAARRDHACRRLRWPSLAPDGKHVLIAQSAVRAVSACATARRGTTRARARSARRVTTVDRSGHAAASRTRACIVTVLTPRRPRGDASASPKGALTHGEITLDQILFMRPVAGLGTLRDADRRTVSRRSRRASRAGHSRRGGMVGGEARILR